MPTIVGVQPPALVSNIITCFGGSMPDSASAEIPGVDQPGLPNLLFTKVKIFAQPLFDFIEMFVKPILGMFQAVSDFINPPPQLPVKVIKVAIKLAAFFFAYPIYTMMQAIDKLTNEFKTIAGGITATIVSSVSEAKNRLTKLQGQAAEQFQGVVDSATQTKDKIVAIILKTLMGFVTSVPSIISIATKLLSEPQKIAEELVNKVVAEVSEAVASAANSSIAIEVRFWLSILPGVIMGAMKLVVFIFSLPVLLVKSILTVVKDVMTDIATKFVDVIAKQVKYFIDLITDPVIEAVKAVSEALEMGEHIVKLIKQCLPVVLTELISSLQPDKMITLSNLVTLSVAGSMSLPNMSIPGIEVPTIPSVIPEEQELQDSKDKLSATQQAYDKAIIDYQTMPTEENLSLLNQAQIDLDNAQSRQRIAQDKYDAAGAAATSSVTGLAM